MQLKTSNVCIFDLAQRTHSWLFTQVYFFWLYYEPSESRLLRNTKQIILIISLFASFQLDWAMWLVQHAYNESLNTLLRNFITKNLRQYSIEQKHSLTMQSIEVHHAVVW